MKVTKILLLSAVCLSLSSCGSVGRTLDCTDLWRFDNCILFEKQKVKPGPGGVRIRGGKVVYPQSHNNSPNIYKSYRPPKIKKPAKVWGKAH
ncbi:MAG: hypothetical protein DHS20C02_12250 [Micavibrio sp.]|nr:MAG: hypothetical protein DHS20C02_12250 [Micavibrio sp.]